MPALARKPSAIVAALLMAIGAPAALHVVGTKTATSSTTTAAGAATTPSIPIAINTRIGMNLTPVPSPGQAALLNRAKQGGVWGSYQNGVWNAYTATNNPSMFNADGYPLTLPPGGGQWISGLPLDPASGTPYKQTYVLRWKGTGTMTVGGVEDIVTSDHRVTFTNVNAFMLINITATDPNDPVRDVSVVRADQVADYDAGKIFNPAFVDRVVRPFKSFRTMDWDQTNNSTEKEWSDRQKPSDAVYTRMPLELEVALANEAKVDLWKTIPAMASDAYVRQILSYIKANLSPSLKLHLEYSNEVWNGGFQQSQWAAQQAQALWNTASFPASTFYGYRAAQIASTAWSIFGSNSTQLRPVLAGWNAYTGREVTDAMALGVSKAAKGTIGGLFREYAIAPYFGDSIGTGTGNAADAATVLAWAKDPTPQGLNNAFQEIEHGGLLQVKGTSLDDNKYRFQPFHAAWARQNNLALVAYEGGLSFYFFSADPATKPTLLAFYARMIADPRMGVLYARWMSDFSSNGGTLIENYIDVGDLSEWGPWGSIPTIYANDTPRYVALRTYAALPL